MAEEETVQAEETQPQADEAEPEEEQGDPWQKLADAIDAYAIAVKKEEAGTLGEEERSPTDIKPGIDTTYWRLMGEQVTNLVPANLSPNLVFDERLMYALNYGLLKDSQKFGWGIKKVQPFLPAAPTHRVYKCVYVTEALNQAYRTILKIDTIKKMTDQLDRIKKAIDEAPGERAEAIKLRTEAVHTGITTKTDADKLLAVFAQLDENLEPMKMMEKKNREGGFSGKEERQRYISLNQAMEQRHEQINYLLERYGDAAPEVRKHNQEADDSLSNLIQLRADKLQKEKDIEKEKSAVHNITLSDVKAGLDEECAKLKGNGRLTARLGKASQISIPLEERDLMTADKAYEALTEIEEFDPNLFSNRSTKLKGIPALYIVPGIGEGIYDWEGHRLLVPTMYTRTPLASVASAVVLYKIDVDQSYSDRELMLSYKNDIKENKKMRSMIKLRQQLIKEYLLWITKEAKGFPLMEKQSREWFEYRIGPNKHDPKFPPDMRNLTMKQQREGLEAELKKPESALTLFRQALFHYLMDKENGDIMSKEVYPRLEKAMQLDAANLDILFSTAAVYKRAKNKRCIDLFIEYTKKAPQSWWSKKALEHVTTFKA